MKILSLLLTAMFFSTSALAIAPITPTITGYNVENAAPSGTGGWSHDYDGNIIDVGNGLRDYEGGTGTLADGVIGNSVLTTQLFRITDNTSITVFLDDYYAINSVSLFGGPTSNVIPGQITEATFTFPNLYLGSTKTGIPFGDLNSEGTPVNDLFEFNYYEPYYPEFGNFRPPGYLYEYNDFMPFVNQFTISNVSGDWGGYYSITEIQVSAVPEPSTYALMLGGLGLVGFMAMRRRHTA